MYENVLLRAKANSRLGPTIPVYSRLQQRCVLSPVFLILFTRGLPEVFGPDCVPPAVGNYPVNRLMYADDLFCPEQQLDCNNAPVGWKSTAKRGDFRLIC